MKRTLLALCLMVSVGCLAQGYINLSFDNPDLSDLMTAPGGGMSYGIPSKLVPGWNIQSAGQPVDRVWYNAFDGTGVYPAKVRQYSEGGFLMVFNPWHLVDGVLLRNDPVEIAQSGIVPQGSTDFVFYYNANVLYAEAYVNGVRAEFQELRPTWYSLDVSLYGGKETNLKFVFTHFTEFDSIGFVPEPSSEALSVLGLASFLLVYRFRNSTIAKE